MSSTVSTAFISQFSANIHTLVREGASKLRGLFPTDMAKGEKHFFERIGSLAVSEVTARNEILEIQDAAHTRRMATVRKYFGRVTLDDMDKMKMLIDPTSEYAKALADGHGANFDAVVYAAMVGTAATGQDGTGTQAFDSNNIIAHGSAGLTVAKLHQGLKLLEAAEIDIDRVPLYMPVGAAGVEDLMTDSTNGVQISSFDYQATKTMATGTLPNFRGINIIRTQRVPDSTAGSVFRALLFTADAMKVAMVENLDVRVDERVDMAHVAQITAYMMFGAVRMEEAKVISILYQ